MKISVVIPAYRVREKILAVLTHIDSRIDTIFVVDDKCPEQSGHYVAANTQDPRINVLYNEVNLGVGGATLAGFQEALKQGADILVKLDGDGQMDPTYIQNLVVSLQNKKADYAKGNRFFNPEDTKPMPFVRLLGNLGLSFLTKMSSGYWNIFDPNNGFVAISAKVFKMLPVAKLDQRYFFESDLLFRLNVMRAVVVDVPIPAHYADETSSLSPLKEFFRFAFKNIRNCLKRIIYNYFIRDFNIASLELVISLLLLLFGALFGGYHWIAGNAFHPASPGTVMVAALPIILGMQLLLSFLQYDIAMVPRDSLQEKLL